MGDGPRTFRMGDHGSWGNTIAWWTLPDSNGHGRVHGWLQRRPQPGDRIISPMRSGRNGIFVVAAEGNNYPYDPPDQFFCNVDFTGYEDTNG